MESKYSYVEKLALAAIQVVQRFRHYILLRKTTIISDFNPMTYILSCQLPGGKHSKWIVILLDFDFEFTKSKSNNLSSPSYFEIFLHPLMIQHEKHQSWTSLYSYLVK